MGYNITVLLNNFPRFENSHKKINVYQYLKKNDIPVGIVFLQETHSSEKNFEVRWTNEFKGSLFFLTQNNFFL